MGIQKPLLVLTNSLTLHTHYVCAYIGAVLRDPVKKECVLYIRYTQSKIQTYLKLRQLFNIVECANIPYYYSFH